MKTNHTLAIVGNGFDLAHDYCTDYRSFVNKASDKNLDEFKAYCEKEEEIKTWYDFENNINILTEKAFQRIYSEYTDSDNAHRETEHLLEIFNQITILMMEYLKTETSKKECKKLDKVKLYVTPQTEILNFNYSSTAETYSKKVIYIHGSLNESDILLGYDYRNAGCLEQYEDMYWSKDLLREGLCFRRYLSKTLKIKRNSEKFTELISSFQRYQSMRNSSRGIDDEAEKELPDFDFITNFFMTKNKQLPNIKYKKIKTVVILGHSIEADIVYLRRILSKCKNLKKIILFRYSKEPDTSINKKKEFLYEFCRKIKVVYYNK